MGNRVPDPAPSAQFRRRRARPDTSRNRWWRSRQRAKLSLCGASDDDSRLMLGQHHRTQLDIDRGPLCSQQERADCPNPGLPFRSIVRWIFVLMPERQTVCSTPGIHVQRPCGTSSGAPPQRYRTDRAVPSIPRIICGTSRHRQPISRAAACSFRHTRRSRWLREHGSEWPRRWHDVRHGQSVSFCRLP